MDEINKKTECTDCKDHTNRIARNEIDIQSIFTMVNALLWKIAVITGGIMAFGQGVTILIVLKTLK